MRIGRFQVIEPLAGQGDRLVLAAYDARLDRKVIVELGARLDDDEAGAHERRQRARAMARLQHPNVVRVHEVGEHEGELFVATDFVRGGTLAAWCREHPRGSRKRFVALLELMIQATRGLAAAHAAEVVGVPLGADDMLVDDEGRLRLRGWTSTAATIREHEPAAVEPDPRDDQRALCRTFWEAALGSAPPEPGVPDQPTTTARSEVPAWFRAALRRGLAPEPRDRWPHVDALRAALERGRDDRRRRIGAVAGVAGVAAVGLVLLSPSPPDACPPADDAPSQGWAARREQLEQRFASHDLASADGPSGYTLRRLDDMVERWDAEHLAACTAAAHDEPGAAARLGCLERAAVGFEAVLSEIEQLEPERLRSASSLTLALPDLQECDAPDPRMAAEDRDTAARAAARRLAEAGTLVELRRVTKAEELLTALEAQGWASSARIESRGRIFQAQVAYARGDFDRSYALALAGLDTAEQDDFVNDAAVAWGTVVPAELARRRVEEAAFALERAESLATSVGNTLLLAHLAQLRANVERTRGRPEASVAAFQHAEELLRTQHGEGHASLASLHQDQVPMLGLLGRLEEAVESARTAVTMFEALVGPDNPRTVRARGVLGFALADLGAREEAIEVLGRTAEALAADPTSSPDDRFVVGIKRAEQLGMVGRTDEAVAVLERVEPPANDPEARLTLALIHGTVLLEGGRAAEAASIYEAALASLSGEASHAIAMNRAIMHLNLADALAQSGRAEEAVALVPTIIGEYEALGMSEVRWGIAWTDLAGVYRAAGRLEDARQAAERAVAKLQHGDATRDARTRAQDELAAVEAALRGEEPAP